MMGKHVQIVLYFSLWIVLALICLVLNVLNIDWTRTHIRSGTLNVVVFGIIQCSLLEILVQAITTLIIGGKRRRHKKSPCDDLKVILNYNLLATSKDNILECINNMYISYVCNMGPNVSAVVVSATKDNNLKIYELQVRDKYRALLYDELYNEGLAFARNDNKLVDPNRLQHVWSKFVDIEKDVFINDYLANICKRYAKEFMVLHRVSRVLRKCGQYQDLMILSEGELEAYSYCDKNYYGKFARDAGQPLFHAGDDVLNIYERKFDYTLVLDADTRVPSGMLLDLLQIAAANPDRGIIQPQIKQVCSSDDSIFMHLEAMREIYIENTANAMSILFGQSSYDGKALINNRLYIDYVIGKKDALTERVPVDILNHDTFEATLLQPLDAGSTYVIEKPTYNFVTSNIREKRWTCGEILLATYLWNNAFGKPLRWIQHKLYKSKFNNTQLRTQSKLHFISLHIATFRLRSKFIKPALLLYIFLHIMVNVKYPNVSIMVASFSVLVFPKIAICNRENCKYLFLETLVSILQFPSESIVCCVRIITALHANLSQNLKWIPQRVIEVEFTNSNPCFTSIKYLWGYSLFALISAILAMLYLENLTLILAMLIAVFFLPLYTGITSLTPSMRWYKTCNKYPIRE